ncbi:MAG: hypothetical protein ACK6CP_13710 [Pseudanabaena sp.]|jgi:hypothetical protein|nr:hypothetical protein [Pseudanabaena sp. M090S1SP2A07QC]MCA6508258.1 hypothetical protein [Pseudanabaena sp. M172S2SP2A07QC]MCA6521125.1 hypothetical protein [Pseudanabaena sp. M051S1SP2A07QC]MCA6526828.1 hypothetical protein [Pseudanabaena sp. M179S2SP2A07QC]MCA6532559.1 hypothetical protein [Pseudanabaena sp. M125S2SP2A07QC]MCA6532621.1 hypothetical protein [Pseudanabaena sp. M176S2SP2A07QC]MCA6538398.1 hypothetical protein [Pseudanabaena sp. M037S2SP2A07QC]MCA6541686.1 hypothetical prot
MIRVRDRDILLHNALHLPQSTQTKCKVFNSDIAILNEIKESQPAGAPSQTHQLL